VSAKESRRPVHTYSIVAVDKRRAEIGVAVQSHWFSVAGAVPWAEAGVGAVATQSFVNRSFGPRGLKLLRQGLSPKQVVEELRASDKGREMRQLAVIDSEGRAAAYTGDRCVPEAGHHVGDGYSVQANMMMSAEVWPAMAEAFEAGEDPLAERLVEVLEAAQGCGGDIRGRQSACLLIVKAQPSGQPWNDRLIDLRVEDHPRPVEELKRLLKVFRAYEHMERGDRAFEQNDHRLALQEYGRAQELYPGNPEMKYWCAVSLANMGEIDRSLPLFQEVFHSQNDWRILTERLFKMGMLKVAEDQYRSIVQPEEPDR